MKLVGTVLIALLISAPLVVAEQVSLDSLIVNQIYDDYKLDRANHKIEVLSNSLNQDLVAPDQITYRSLSQKEPLGLFTILVMIEGQSGQERGQIRLRVRKYAEVLVANQKIRRHEEITNDDVILKTMEVTSLYEQPVDMFEQAVGFRARRNLSKGKIIMRNAIEPVPDIEVGWEVSIIFDDGLCRITAPGRALKSGSIGDRIKVKNISSRKTVYARILDAETVTVEIASK